MMLVFCCGLTDWPKKVRPRDNLQASYLRPTAPICNDSDNPQQESRIREIHYGAAANVIFFGDFN